MTIKSKKNFTPHLIGFLCAEVGVFVVVPICITIIIDQLNQNNYKAALFLASGTVFMISFMSALCYKFLKIKYNKYQFDGNGFYIEPFVGKKEYVKKDDIKRCQFYPQFPLYEGVYSDTVFLTIKNHKYLFLRDFHENFDELRKWIIANNIKVEAFNKMGGERNRKFIEFVNKEK